MAMTYEAISVTLRKARELSSDIYIDLQYLERSHSIITKHWTMEMNDAALELMVGQVNSAMTEYLQWAHNCLDDGGGERGSTNAPNELLS